MNKKAKQLVINCWGLLWIYEDGEVIWLSKDGHIFTQYENLPDDLREDLEKNREVIWESDNIKFTE